MTTTYPINYAIHPQFAATQIEAAARLVVKFTQEPAFWEALAAEFKDSGITDDLIFMPGHIVKHLHFMFTGTVVMVTIIPYSTRNPFSSVLGHASGAVISENTRKLNSLTLPERVGHIGHETTHLFGYSHDVQGSKKSATVIFGECLEKYAEVRCKELGLS